MLGLKAGIWTEDSYLIVQELMVGFQMQLRRVLSADHDLVSGMGSLLASLCFLAAPPPARCC